MQHRVGHISAARAPTPASPDVLNLCSIPLVAHAALGREVVALVMQLLAQVRADTLELEVISWYLLIRNQKLAIVHQLGECW